MLRSLLHQPSAVDLQAFLHEHLRAGDCLIQVISTCEVLYHGRAMSIAEAGDYLVILKCDGSLMVHGPKSVKPINWQTKTDDVRVHLSDGRLTLTSERFKPPETVSITFLDALLAQAFQLEEGDFTLQGTEAQMRAALRKNPQLIEADLRVLYEELPVEVGDVDLYAQDKDGCYVIVELKRSKATQEAVHQLSRYVQAVQGRVTPRVRGILAAPAMTAPARVQLEALGLEFVVITALPVEEPETQQLSLF